MRRFSVVGAFSAAVLIGLAGLAQAGTVNMTLVVSNDYNAAGTALHTGTAAQIAAAAQADSQNGVAAAYQVQVDIALGGTLAAGEVYGNNAWAFTYGAGLSIPSANAGAIKKTWVSTNPVTTGFDSNGNSDPALQVFSKNSDVSAGSFNNMLVTVDGTTLGDAYDQDGNPLGPGADPRTTYVTTNPTLIGTLYVNWNGTTTATLGTSGLQYSTATPNGFWADGNTKYTLGNATNAQTNPSVTFNAVAAPEPGTLLLLGLGGLGLVAARRRRSA